MRAVNLLPDDGRRRRASSGGGAAVDRGAFGPAQFLVVLMVIVVALVALRVLADNTVNNKKATLAAVSRQLTQEQAVANQLSQYVTFVKNIQITEAQIIEIAEQRFPWKRTLDQISRVLPASTSLTSLAATPGTASTTGQAAGPTFTLAGCAHTSNQDGVATVLRRLNRLVGATVGFQSSTRSSTCGNDFDVTLSYAAADGSATAAPVRSASTVGTATSSTTTTTTTTTTTGTGN